MNIPQSIANNKKLIILVFVIVLLTIVFETAQQLFYVRRFDLAENVTFLELFKNHTYRWLVWLVLSIFLFKYIRKNSKKEFYSASDFLKYGMLIFGLVILSITIISVMQMVINGDYSIPHFLNEYLPFYTFQKLPIYSLGYISLAFIFHFYLRNKTLQIKVHNFGELKAINEKLYEKLQHHVTDSAPILNIKIGNKRKVIPVNEIYWIEADDYCAKIHLANKNTYSMRISLKALENKLGENFLRVHRKAIVNMQMVSEFRKNGQNQLLLRNEIEIPVSLSNVKTIRSFLHSSQI